EQVRLREEQAKTWVEIAKVWEEIKALREGQARLEERVGSLEERVGSLEGRVDSLRSAMIAGFGEIGRFAGMTFEEFVRKFLSEYLRKAREIPEGAELAKYIVDGGEVNLFLEEPLIVGEATGHAESAEEITKLLRKAEAVKAKYSREPRKILVTLSAKRSAAREMKEIAKERGVELIIGKVVD
ncbi:MAG: hypothetical protein N3H31_07325, partial [Candidatus Nezhaarchaeota archaeon]|nr:hypothetical protein [Candidatus Nezhaarchaeota archaeon]